MYYVCMNWSLPCSNIIPHHCVTMQTEHKCRTTRWEAIVYESQLRIYFEMFSKVLTLNISPTGWNQQNKVYFLQIIQRPVTKAANRASRQPYSWEQTFMTDCWGFINPKYNEPQVVPLIIEHGVSWGNVQGLDVSGDIFWLDEAWQLWSKFHLRVVWFKTHFSHADRSCTLVPQKQY